jgi:hypothetical protein
MHKVCNRQIYHCHYAIFVYHKKEKALHEPTLRSRQRTSEQSFVAAYRFYSVSADNILLRVCEELEYII